MRLKDKALELGSLLSELYARHIGKVVTLGGLVTGGYGIITGKLEPAAIGVFTAHLGIKYDRLSRERDELVGIVNEYKNTVKTYEEAIKAYKKTGEILTEQIQNLQEIKCQDNDQIQKKENVH